MKKENENENENESENAPLTKSSLDIILDHITTEWRKIYDRSENLHRGSDFNKYLKDEGIYDEVNESSEKKYNAMSNAMRNGYQQKLIDILKKMLSNSDKS